MTSPDAHLQIGSLLFEGLDQIDLTGPFEVLSRMPNSTYRLFARAPSRCGTCGACGLRLMPYFGCAQLDLLHVPGGFGQEA
jgi:cyclohexyl-isocyanide hydratase